MRAGHLICLFAVGGLGLASAAAGIYSDIYSGLEILATPSGYPLLQSSDGTYFNGNRSGRLRIMPSGLGGGYELQFDRTFGSDSSGRTEVMRLMGIGEVALQGATQFTAGYNGEKFRTVYGSFAASSLNYDMRTKLGVQDAEVYGALNISGSFEVNPLGFYTVNFNASNSNSALELDGVLVRDTDDMDFDVGPVTLKGNIYIDGLAAVLNTFGVDTSGLEALFPSSTIGTLSSTVAGETLTSDTTTSDDMAALLLQAVLGQDGTAAEQYLTSVMSTPATESSSTTTPISVPEPGTLVLLALGFGVVSRRWAPR